MADDDRTRTIIRRVAAMTPDELPPGPQPYVRCPTSECDERVGAWPKAIREHRERHDREREQQKQRQRAQTRQEATRRLRTINELRAETRAAERPSSPPEPGEPNSLF